MINIQKRAKSAVGIAEKLFQIKLDYSDDSIKNVELILDKTYDKRDDRNMEIVNGFTLIFGCYITKTIERNHRGIIVQNTIKDVPNIKIGETTCFPLYWCYKRLTLGEEDNVWHKYLFLKSDAFNK